MLRKIGTCLKRNLFLYCAILSLLLPDIVLRAQNGGLFPISWVATVFTILWITIILLCCSSFMSKNWGRGIYLVVAILFMVFMVSSYIYYRIFNRFYWLDNASMTGQALDYFGYVLGYVDWKLILSILAEAGLIFLAFRFWRDKPYRVSGLFLIVPVVGLVTLHTSMMTGQQLTAVAGEVIATGDIEKETYYNFTDANRSMNVAGAYQYVLRCIFRMVFPEVEPDHSNAEIVDEYFASRPADSDNEVTRLFEGKNVIIVMLESMDDWLLDEKYTPTICYMQQNGIQFKNHFSCTFGTGYTFNTEFAANTGYHALPAGTPAMELSENTYRYSLANLFREKGYAAKSFHYNKAEFYNRGEMHSAFGYQEYISFQNYMPAARAQCDSEVIRNEKIYKKMVSEKPFANFVITYSAHLPYTYEDEKLHFLKKKYADYVDPYMDTEINNAKILAHDTDEFLRILLENLRRDGLAEDTVIVGFADHFAYGLSNWKKMYVMSNATTADMLEKTPFFIYCDGMTGRTVDKVTNSLDILPTICNLFGLQKTPYRIGEDAFDPAYAGYAYFSNGSWYDGNIYYFADEHLNTYPPEQLAYIEEMNRYFLVREKVNEFVLKTDYFKSR